MDKFERIKIRIGKQDVDWDTDTGIKALIWLGIGITVLTMFVLSLS